MVSATAAYFDGRDVRLHAATLTVDAGHLHIAAPGLERSVPLAAVTPTESFAHAPRMLRLGDGGCCELPPGPATEALLATLGWRQGIVARWQAQPLRALFALPLLVALLALVYFQLVPLVAEPVAATLPLSLDLGLGRSMLTGLEDDGELRPSGLPAARVDEVQALLAQALPAHPRLPIRLLVRDAPLLGANAFALPDGTIVMTDAMVRLALTPDGRLPASGKAELVAVIGHEVGHVEHRHMARVMVASSLGAALSTALFGDFSAAAAGLPALLSRMRYSRAMELDADDYAVAVLRHNGMGPAPLDRALTALERQAPVTDADPRWLKHAAGYLSTHPATPERIARLRALP